ncbi:hypothetical protein [Anaerotignum sp. MSJ-24]|uniref:hypothetical protein n=1 Tax=Anaerotignum sp. MSJ-24 TaxID=2841521 RepID=UPI001C11A4E1|nr:hypothetical protein [Anaerotignum sp. MSJ-24]MBU5463269.1 hypothetical protein [Anaerotignum sp. MSJ-24]
MTWGDIQLSVLHKLFVSDGQTILVNDSTSPYIAAMPLAANEGLMLLAACGKYIPKTIETETAESVTDLSLKELAENFLSLRENEVFLNGRHTDGYTLIGGERMLLYGIGKWIIGYNAYPQKITQATDKDYVLDVPEDAAVLLPLYIAAELYKDEDPQTAAIYRNEFEAGREALLYRDTAKSGHMCFESVSKWI